MLNLLFVLFHGYAAASLYDQAKILTNKTLMQ